MARGLIFILALALAAGCGNEPARTDAGDPQGVEATQPAPAVEASPQGAAAGREVSAGTVYVDVRTPGEFAAGHVAGAINIPHTEMEARWRELAEYRDRPVVLYCRSGHRAGIAYDILEPKGFTRLENGGGLTELEARGVPVTR